MKKSNTLPTIRSSRSKPMSPISPLLNQNASLNSPSMMGMSPIRISVHTNELSTLSRYVDELVINEKLHRQVKDGKKKVSPELFYKLNKLHDVAINELVKQVEVHCPIVAELIEMVWKEEKWLVNLMNNSIVTNNNQIISLNTVVEHNQLEKKIRSSEQQQLISSLQSERSRLETILRKTQAELDAEQKHVKTFQNEISALRSVIDAEVHGYQETSDEELAKYGDGDTAAALRSTQTFEEMNELIQSMEKERLNIAHFLMEYQRVTRSYEIEEFQKYKNTRSINFRSQGVQTDVSSGAGLAKPPKPPASWTDALRIPPRVRIYMHAFSRGKIVNKDQLKDTIKTIYISLKLDAVDKPYLFSFASYVCTYIAHLYIKNPDLADWHISELLESIETYKDDIRVSTFNNLLLNVYPFRFLEVLVRLFTFSKETDLLELPEHVQGVFRDNVVRLIRESMYLKTYSIEELVNKVENFPCVLQGKVTRRDILDCDKILELLHDYYYNHIYTYQKEKLENVFRHECTIYAIVNDKAIKIDESAKKGFGNDVEIVEKVDLRGFKHIIQEVNAFYLSDIRKAFVEGKEIHEFNSDLHFKSQYMRFPLPENPSTTFFVDLKSGKTQWTIIKPEDNDTELTLEDFLQLSFHYYLGVPNPNKILM